LYQKINNENEPILITKIVPPQEKMIKAVGEKVHQMMKDYPLFAY